MTLADSDPVIRIGTRGSLLATTRPARSATRSSRSAGRLNWSSSVPRGSVQSPVAEIGVGVFTAALREAIADGGSTWPCTPTKTCRQRRTSGSSSPPCRPAKTRVTPSWPATAWSWGVAGGLGDRYVVRSSGAQLRALGLGLEIRP